MENMVTREDLRVYSDVQGTCEALAEALVALANACCARQGRFTVALSGGKTPEALFRILAEKYHDALPWQKIHLFWGDDRFVPHDDPSSNYRMARLILLDHVSIPTGNIHPMPIFFRDINEAAADYEATLKSYFEQPWPRFDLILLGLGADGHTASLFPHSEVLRRRDRWVAAVLADTKPPLRLTLTLPVINNAAHVWFLITGASKAPALLRALTEGTDPETCPARAVRPTNGELLWWLDAPAASLLRQVPDPEGA